MPKLKLITYGCQANDLDSERITGLLLREGFTLTEQEEEADLIVLNTCAIREKAEHKVYSRLGSFQALKRQRAGLKIGICGCVAQQEGQALLNRFPYLDFVVGPASSPLFQRCFRPGRREEWRRREQPATPTRLTRPFSVEAASGPGSASWRDVIASVPFAWFHSRGPRAQPTPSGDY